MGAIIHITIHAKYQPSPMGATTEEKVMQCTAHAATVHENKVIGTSNVIGDIAVGIALGHSTATIKAYSQHVEIYADRAIYVAYPTGAGDLILIKDDQIIADIKQMAVLRWRSTFPRLLKSAHEEASNVIAQIEQD